MAEWGDASVRVTGIRRGRFVEFDFSLGEELTIELVLPYREFGIFCEEHHCRMLPAEGEAALELMQLAQSTEAATTTKQSSHSGSSSRHAAGQEDTT
jgi:hypothetical protein